MLCNYSITINQLLHNYVITINYKLTMYLSPSWWYGRTSRAEAERILKTEGGDGSFLVRDSEANPGWFTFHSLAKLSSHIRLTFQQFDLNSQRLATFLGLAPRFV